MWSDPIERALLQMRSALEAIQRGHTMPFGELDRMLAEALQVRETERATGKVIQP
jgi:hypothetical protein